VLAALAGLIAALALLRNPDGPSALVLGPILAVAAAAGWRRLRALGRPRRPE
jgi:hypothetical protein